MYLSEVEVKKIWSHFDLIEWYMLFYISVPLCLSVTTIKHDTKKKQTVLGKKTRTIPKPSVKSKIASYTNLYYTPTKSWRVMFSLQFDCVYEYQCECVSEQNSSQTNASIWTRFLLFGCLSHCLKPYWNCWAWVKGRGHSDVISIRFFIIFC